MIKRILKGVVYFCGCVFILGALASACVDDNVDQAKVVETEKGTVMVIPEDPDSEVEIIEPQEEPEADFIFIEGPECSFGDFSNNITGILKNNTNKDFDYVQLSFSLFDANGNVVDTAFTNISNLKAGRTWKFEAMFFEDNVTSWELDEITGW